MTKEVRLGKAGRDYGQRLCNLSVGAGLSPPSSRWPDEWGGRCSSDRAGATGTPLAPVPRESTLSGRYLPFSSAAQRPPRPAARRLAGQLARGKAPKAGRRMH